MVMKNSKYSVKSDLKNRIQRFLNFRAENLVFNPKLNFQRIVKSQFWAKIRNSLIFPIFRNIQKSKSSVKL